MSESTPTPTPAPGDPATPGPVSPTVSVDHPPKCDTRTRRYLHGAIVDEGFAPMVISDMLAADDDSVIWLDLHDPDLDDLRVITEEFGLHPLAVEDAVHDRQRPKLDRYPTHLFANVYAVHVPDPASPRLVTAEISMFVTSRALITVRKSDFDVDTLIARWDVDRRLAREGGVSYLLYGVLDAVVDGHYQVIEALEDLVEDLEEALFEPHAELDIRRRGFELRRSLASMRRIVLPMQELVGRLMRNDLSVSVEALEPYYRDVYDHVQRTAESVDSARDMVASVLDADLNEKSNELNEITKKLASWAAIIAVPTAVTGYFGQNVPYPGFGTHDGFWMSILVMLALAGGVWWLLRRQGWL